MQKMKIPFLTLITLVFVSKFTFGQDTGEQPNPITTAVPFLLIAPDARGGGMGDNGVSSSPDAYSIYWNSAKYAFAEKDFGFGIGYVPWLRGLVNDIGLASVCGYKKFGDKQAIAASLRFFSMGSVTFTNDIGQELGDVKPNEWTIDLTYSRKFSQVVSGAVSARYIYSNLVPVNYTKYDVKPGQSVAADIAIYVHKPLEIQSLAGASIDFGLCISNLGAKISYSGSSTLSDFLPANLRIGPSFTMDIDEYNRVSILLDLNKLLVPTPPIYAKDTNGQPVIGPDGNKVIDKGMDPNVSAMTGVFHSFYDAPFGFKEEMQEINVSAAIEYWYNKLFSFRMGYFYESPYKGDRQFFTLGAGLRYNVFGLDFSYLIPIKQNNPLQNTMQFTLLFNFDGNKKQKDTSTKEQN
jgi:hypothetical protein